MYKDITRIILVIIVLMLSGISSFAQQEIPAAIKDKILNGINYLENSKTPEDINKAVKEFTDAAEIAPEYADVHYYLGKTLSMMQGYAGKAVKELKKYLELYPDAPDIEKVSSEIAQLEDVIKTKNKYYLLGLSLVQLPDGIYVLQVSPNFPKDRFTTRVIGFGGIKAGDKIIKVNDIDISDYSIQSLMKLIEADSATNRYHEITVMRAGSTSKMPMYKGKVNYISALKELGEEDLAAIISETKKPLVVFFVSYWCENCDKYNSTISYYANMYKDSSTFIIANIDESTYLSKEFDISQTPTIYMYNDGELIEQMLSYDTELLKKKLEKLMK